MSAVLLTEYYHTPPICPTYNPSKHTVWCITAFVLVKTHRGKPNGSPIQHQSPKPVQISGRWVAIGRFFACRSSCTSSAGDHDFALSSQLSTALQLRPNETVAQFFQGRDCNLVSSSIISRVSISATSLGELPVTCTSPAHNFCSEQVQTHV